MAAEFELRVEFAGLCLYVLDRDRRKVSILMPDARGNKGEIDDLHADGEIGEAHTGYVRFDLANLNAGSGLSVTAGQDLGNASGSPPCEVVIRFDRQEMEFLLPDGSTLPATPFEEMDPGVPEFGKFADPLKPDAAVLGRTPPEKLLMRTVINGGTLRGKGEGKTWGFSSALRGSTNGNGSAPSYSGQFAGFALWTRTIDADGITLKLSRLDGSGEATTIPLKPAMVDGKRVIALKVANLCAHNPLEWDEYPLRNVVAHDLDFKWLYRLLEPPGGDFKRALAGAEFPYPRALPNQAYGDEDCMGGSITFP